MSLLLAVLLAAAPPAQTYRVLSQTYTIDKKYRSMEGPSSVITVHLGDQQKPELVWLTGIKTEVVTPDRLAELLPGCRIDDVGAAAWEPDSGFADPNATTFAFAEAALRTVVGTLLSPLLMQARMLAMESGNPTLRTLTSGQVSRWYSPALLALGSLLAVAPLLARL